MFENVTDWNPRRRKFDSHLHDIKQTRFDHIRTCGVALTITMRLIDNDCYRGCPASIETSSA